MIVDPMNLFNPGKVSSLSGHAPSQADGISYTPISSQKYRRVFKCRSTATSSTCSDETSPTLLYHDMHASYIICHT